MKNGQREETTTSSSRCNIHPKETLVGVCPLCLNERLLILLASQPHRKRSPTSPPLSSSRSHNDNINNNDNSIIKSLQNLPESNPFNKKKHRGLFSFSSSFLGFLHNHHDHHDSFISPEDSFISIKFEENGATSWERGKMPTTISWDRNDVMEDAKEEMMIQHPGKSRPSMTWCRQIGQILHVIRLRRPSACHVSSKVEGGQGPRPKRKSQFSDQ